MPGSRVESLLAEIASLTDAERRELFSRLGIVPRPTHPGQPTLLRDFSANTLQGPADYVLVFDGGSEGNPGRGYGSYAVMRGDTRDIKRIEFSGDMTNNEAEYSTLLRGLDDIQGRIERSSRSPEEFSIEVRGDSILVLNQVSGEWKAKDDRMRHMRDSVRRALQRFKANRLRAQPREETVVLLGH